MQIGEAVNLILQFFGIVKPVTVTQIKASVPGTRGVRKASDTRPDDVLTPSSSSATSLSANAPVILVRGCNDVELEAVTSPPNKPVLWRVESNENRDRPPVIIPKGGGQKATLKTNVHGSFSVIAEAGASRVVWNVVFVWVKVLVDTTVVAVQNNKYAHHPGSTPTFTMFRSGEFIPGKFAWTARVDVQVVGGGNSKKLGTDKVKVHLLQNGVRDTLTGHYSPVGKAVEVPKGGSPVLDANDASSPFLFVASAIKVTPNQTAVKRRVWTGDSPAGAFPRTHKNVPSTLSSISGVNGFAAMIAGVSDQATNSIVVHARIDWSADFSGTVAAATGIYTRRGARTKSDKKYKRVSNGTGGQDAFAAGAETFEPRFNAGTDTVFTP